MNLNPSDMSNDDQEKDLASRDQIHNSDNKLSKQEDIVPDDFEPAPDEKPLMEKGVEYKEDVEQDLDDLVHEQSKVKHDGNTPDPETLKLREGL